MNKKILIVLANYYKNISDGLLKSALKNIPKSNQVKIIKVPGVFEIPVTISKNLKKSVLIMQEIYCKLSPSIMCTSCFETTI